MKKSYKISRIIIGIAILIIFYIFFRNEDKSWLVIPWIFAIITYGISFITSMISKKIIEIGNKFKSKGMKILFYLLLPISILGLFILIVNYIILPISYLNEPDTTDIGTALSHGIFYIFMQIVVFIGLVLPYVQTLIVLILNYFRKIE